MEMHQRTGDVHPFRQPIVQAQFTDVYGRLRLVALRIQCLGIDRCPIGIHIISFPREETVILMRQGCDKGSLSPISHHSRLRAKAIGNVVTDNGRSARLP